MIKSKFTFWNILIVIIAAAFSFLPVMLIMDKSSYDIYGHFRPILIPLLLLIAIAWTWLVLGLLRKRVTILNLDKNKIFVKNFFQSKKEYNLNEFLGFEKTIETSRGGSYEVLYLMKEGKSLIHVSEFNHKNYKEIKELIEQNMQNLGFVPTNIFTNWKRYI